MINISICKDVLQLSSFLSEINNNFPISLSDRVDLNEYAQKVIEKGNVLVALENYKIVSAIIFYSNDLYEKKAYLTLLSTLSDYKRKGYGTALMYEMEIQCIREGMKTIHLDTECSNSSAIKFYNKMGYYIESISERVHMVKELQV